MNYAIALWLTGLSVSVFIGWGATWGFLEILRKHIDKRAEENGELRPVPDIYVPGWLIGIIERTFFTFLVAFDVSGTAVAMMVWVTLKLTQNWRLLAVEEPTVYGRSLAFSTILANVVSMFFALIGGLICK